jgi:hypothetical protein
MGMVQNPGKLDIHFLEQSNNFLRQRPQNGHLVSKNLVEITRRLVISTIDRGIRKCYNGNNTAGCAASIQEEKATTGDGSESWEVRYTLFGTVQKFFLCQRPQNGHFVSKNLMNLVIFRLLRPCHHIACCESVYLT